MNENKTVDLQLIKVLQTWKFLVTWSLLVVFLKKEQILTLPMKMNLQNQIMIKKFKIYLGHYNRSITELTLLKRINKQILKEKA